jgi:GWxTD domain-containing protein
MKMRTLVTMAVALLLTFPLGVTLSMAQEDIAATRGEAAVSENPLEFDRGPAGFLFTKKDKKAWKKINTEAAAEEFIELFWARRNPDPTLSFNPNRAQFDGRVRYADANYSYKGKRGALTDRGRVLILLGPPHQADFQNAAESVQEMETGAFGSDEVRGNMEIWLYDPTRLAADFGVPASRVLFMFYENRAGTNEYILDRSNPNSAVGMRVLAKAPDSFLLHPELQEVPVPVSMPGAEAPAAAHLSWLEQSVPDWTDQGAVVAEFGLADVKHRPVWWHLELPADAPELDLFVGRVRSHEGEVLSTFEVAAEPMSASGNIAYHLGFPLEQGAYTIEVIGGAGGQPYFGYATDVIVPAAVEEGTWMSPVWLAVDHELKDDALLGAPYCFGRLHLVPLSTGSRVQHEKELEFIGFVVRPGVDERGNMRVKARIGLTRDGSKIGRPLDMPLEVVELTDDVYVYMNAINLGALPETGEYGFTFTIRDSVSDVSVERHVDLTIVD